MPNTKNIPHISDNDTLNIVLDTLKLKKQAIVFVNTKRSAEKTAEDISKKVKTENKELINLSENIKNVLPRPTKQCTRLSICIKKGIAFHHAGLTQKQKELIEDSFRSGLIKIICATATLAQGVDLPAFRTILKDLRRFGPRGLSYIPVLEYLQMAGRAGRPKFDSFGEAIAIAVTEPEKKKIYETYVLGEPEDIYSKLAVEPVLRTYLLSLIAANFTRSKKEIIEFFEQTFWALQFKDMDKLERIIQKMLDLLEEWEFIIKESQEDEDFKRADKLDELEDFKVKATLIGKRVAELYIDPLTAHNFILSLREASDKRISEFSFLQMISHTLELKPLLTVRTKEFDKVQEKIVKENNFLLEEEPSMYEPEYEDFLSSIKTAMMFQDWINEKDEDFLLEEFNIRPGEIKAKLDIVDWLLFSSEELTKLLYFKPLLKEISKLRLRLKYGVREELLPLLRLAQVGRVRARKLYMNKIKDISDVKKVNIAVLEQIIGKQTAMTIKKQVGEEVKVIKENKRKGQISLKDYKK